MIVVSNTRLPGMRYYGIAGILLFLFILTRLETDKLLDVVYRTDTFFIFLGAATSLLPFAIKSFRWKLVISQMTGKKIPFRSIVFYSMNSLLVGFVTPGRIGELLLRSKYATDHSQISLGKSFSTVVLDRLNDMAIFLIASIVGIVGIIVFLSGDIFVLTIPIVLMCTALIAFLIFIRKNGSFDTVLRFLFRRLVPDSGKDKAKLNYNDFFSAIRTMKRGNVAATLTLTVFSFFFSVLSSYFVAIGIGMTIPFWYLAVVIPITYIVTLIPISVSGIGTRETSYILLFSLFGIQTETSLMFSLIDLIILNWTVIILLYVFTQLIKRKL